MVKPYSLFVPLRGHLVVPHTNLKLNQDQGRPKIYQGQVNGLEILEIILIVLMSARNCLEEVEYRSNYL